MPNVHNIITAHNRTVLDCKQPKATKNPDRKCNCRNAGRSCPLPGKCLTESVVYQTTVTREDNQQKETYVGHTADPFKVRYYNHTSSFRNPEHKHSTELLSKYIWQLKQSNIQYSIRWKILKKCKAYSNRTEQNRTEQNRTEQNRTEQNRTEQNRTEQNRTEQNRTEQNRTEQNRTEQNRTEQNRTEQNRTERCKICLHEKFIIIYYPKLSSLNSRNELISECRHRKKFLLPSQ